MYIYRSNKDHGRRGRKGKARNSETAQICRIFDISLETPPTIQGFLIDITHLIQSTSSNRICTLILRHIVESKQRILNDILYANPFIRGISEGLKYEHFQGTLKAYAVEILVTSIMWSTFWCEIIPKLVEEFDSSNEETLKFYVSDMPYETYCKELDKFDMEIEAVLGNNLLVIS
ncbi:hypothetical protein ACTXT7_008696 [Hymenolepis weldensis]